ncbi:unnamed protein product [Closterium sp. Yama58-4]|nr:unnamed protein product [Closterium sp. Yama58-4]
MTYRDTSPQGCSLMQLHCFTFPLMCCLISATLEILSATRNGWNQARRRTSRGWLPASTEERKPPPTYFISDDSLARRDWYSVNSPSMLGTRNVCQRLVTRAQGAKVGGQALPCRSLDKVQKLGRVSGESYMAACRSQLEAPSSVRDVPQWLSTTAQPDAVSLASLRGAFCSAGCARSPSNITTSASEWRTLQARQPSTALRLRRSSHCYTV